MKVLVTGADGFAGRHVVSYLLSRTDWRIVALDRSGDLLAELQLDDEPRVRAIEHDLRDAPLPDVIGDVDLVVNLASSSDVAAFLEAPVRHAQNNVTSALNLLDWARRRSLRAFIQVSTNEVYGPVTHERVSVEWDPLLPSTPYSASKAAQEVLAIGWRRTYGVPVVIVNTAHLFGEWQPRQRFVPNAIAKIIAGEPVPIYGRELYGVKLAPVRNWTYAGDFAAAIYWILTHEVGTRALPDRWNVAGPTLTCEQLARRIARYLKLPLEIEWHDDRRSRRPGYEQRYALDTTAFADFGFETRYGLDNGLNRTITWLKRELEA